MALTKVDVLAAAHEIINTYGLADLTMRRLADQLGVRASALYWHYANKQSLLGAVAESILAEVDADACTSALDWAGQLRTTLLRHRDGADVVSSMRAMGLAGLDLPQQVLRHFPTSDVDHPLDVAQTLVIFVLGHVLEEQAHAQWSDLGVATQPAALSDTSFQRGIELIIDGAVRRRSS